MAIGGEPRSAEAVVQSCMLQIAYIYDVYIYIYIHICDM